MKCVCFPPSGDSSAYISCISVCLCLSSTVWQPQLQVTVFQCSATGLAMFPLSSDYHTLAKRENWTLRNALSKQFPVTQLSTVFFTFAKRCVYIIDVCFSVLISLFQPQSGLRPVVFVLILSHSRKETVSECMFCMVVTQFTFLLLVWQQSDRGQPVYRDGVPGTVAQWEETTSHRKHWRTYNS